MSNGVRYTINIIFMGVFYNVKAYTIYRLFYVRNILQVKEGGVWLSSMSSTCECNAKNSVVTNLEKPLHEFGLCTPFIKSFSFLNKTKPFFFQWAISHSPYQTCFHSSSPRWIRLPQAKRFRSFPRNNFFPYFFLGKHAVWAIVWWNWGLRQIVVSPGGLMLQPG